MVVLCYALTPNSTRNGMVLELIKTVTMNVSPGKKPDMDPMMCQRIVRRRRKK